MKKPDSRYIGTKNDGIDIFNYKQYVNQQFLNHRIYDKSNLIIELSHQQDNQVEVRKLIHSVNNIITEIVLAVERSFVKPRHATEWSVELHLTSMIFNYWNIVYKGILNGKIVDAQIKPYFDKLSIAKQEEIMMLRQNKSEYISY